MAGAATTVEKLRFFLSELSPQARAMLTGELERAMLRGEDHSGADLVLQELRRIARDQREGTGRVDLTARLFFKPLEPFFVDDRADHKHSGRIARPAIEPLWTWIGRDLMPEESKTFADEVGEAIIAGDQTKADMLAREFQDRVAATVDQAFTGPDTAKIQRRMLNQVGTPRAKEDIATLRAVLKGRDVLAAVAANLPLRIPNLAPEQLAKYKALIDAAAARGNDLFLYALLTVMNRLSAPWQIIRFGIKAAGSDTAARVAETQYGVTVNIVLAELERLVGELRHDLRSGQGVAVGTLLKTIHDAARGLRTELDLPVDSTWGRMLAAQRAQIADLLRSEIESMPGRVRRLLRQRPLAEIRAGSKLDPDEVTETEALVEFVGACRYFAGELALNEMTQRSYSELQQYLDSGTRALLDSLRHAGEGERVFRQSQVDAAVRLCAKVFGKDYANLLGRAAEVAGGGDRKAARA